MRILAIGYPLPDASVDNYSVLTAPSYHDYDALFIDPESITRDVKLLLDNEKEFSAHDGRPVVNGATTASSVSAADQVKRRAEETERLLEAGGIVVVMGRPNATQPGVHGFEGCDRYSWLPAPEGISWSAPTVKAAEGATIRITDDLHPLADALRDRRKELTYRATFNERSPEVKAKGHIIATGGADTTIAIEFEVLAGRVVFMPVLKTVTGQVRMKIAATMAETITRIAGTTRNDRAPHWTKTLALPGLEQVEAELDEADKAAAEATERAAAVRERFDALASHRRLLWADGTEFDEAVKAALEHLGFQVKSKLGEPLEVADDVGRLFVEAESTKEQVVEWPYVRVQRRLEDWLLRHGQPLAGLVVANGHRGTQPSDRKDQYTKALKTACENYRFCLITGETLFGLVQRALGGADDTTLTGIRRRIREHEGLLELEQAVGTAEEEKGAGPIF